MQRSYWNDRDYPMRTLLHNDQGKIASVDENLYVDLWPTVARIHYRITVPMNPELQLLSTVNSNRELALNG